jgi:small redox-active disulfide protein 2
MKIKILGTGCPNCKVLEANTKKALEELKIKADVEKVTDIVKIMEYGVMSTPALVIDNKVVSYGKVLTSEEIKKLLKGK